MRRLRRYLALGAALLAALWTVASIPDGERLGDRSAPHVETRAPGAARDTHRYQFGGLVAQVQAGVSRRLSGPLSIFGEYKGNYVRLDVDGGGGLRSNLATHTLNVGVSYRFSSRSSPSRGRSSRSATPASAATPISRPRPSAPGRPEIIAAR